MTIYQSIEAIGFAAMATLAITGIVAVFAAVNGDIPTLFFAVCGVVCAFTSVCATDSALAEHMRIYVRRVRR